MPSISAIETGKMDRVGAHQSPFYEWLDNGAIRDLVHRSLELSAGERLVLIQGLVPGLVEAMGIVEFEDFLAEVAIKARRFEEAVEHPGEGRTFRVARARNWADRLQRAMIILPWYATRINVGRVKRSVMPRPIFGPTRKRRDAQVGAHITYRLESHRCFAPVG